MADPLEAMQGATNVALRASAPLIAALNGIAAIFDTVPTDPPWPYLRVGQTDQTIEQKIGCGKGWEVFVDLHIFSRPEPAAPLKGMVEAKRILSLVEDVVVGENDQIPPLDLDGTGYQLIDWSAQSSRCWREQDGISIHGLLTCRYLVTT